MQNLPRTYLKHQDEVRALIKARQLPALEMIYGNVNDLLSQMIRTALIPRQGAVFIDADFSAIEARLIAWEAGEDWVLDVFRTTGKIYETTASKMFGIPVETIRKGNPNYSYRQRGKVATLALGYQGGVGAMRRMDTSGALKDLPDEEIKDMVTRWRQQNPRIVQLWRTMEDAARKAIKNKRGYKAIPGVVLRMEASTTCPFPFLTMSLPSGRKLYYADPRVTDDGHIHYREQTNQGWQDSETYGGKLTENLTQAIGRDCLEFALDNLKQAGYRVVFHIHDEVVIERHTNTPEADLEEVRRIMSTVGCVKGRELYGYFMAGVRELFRQKQPTGLLVYGKLTPDIEQVCKDAGIKYKNFPHTMMGARFLTKKFAGKLAQEDKRNG